MESDAIAAIAKVAGPWVGGLAVVAFSIVSVLNGRSNGKVMTLICEVEDRLGKKLGGLDTRLVEVDRRLTDLEACVQADERAKRDRALAAMVSEATSAAVAAAMKKAEAK